MHSRSGVHGALAKLLEDARAADGFTDGVDISEVYSKKGLPKDQQPLPDMGVVSIIARESPGLPGKTLLACDHEPGAHVLCDFC